MAIGTLAPAPLITILDENGDPVAGALITTTLAGTSTPVSVYHDVTLLSAWTNPVICSEAGRATIYLTPGTSYKFAVTTSDLDPVWTVDNIAAVGNAAVAANQHGVVQGRLTLTTMVPVTTADVTAATAVKFTPYLGNAVTLYDGVNWNLVQFSELSLSITGFAANTNFDVFATPSGATVALASVAWTNSTTRATALTLQDGAYVKSGDATALYLGTVRTTGTVGQTEDSFAKRFVWNYYNRVQRSMRRQTTGTWSYTTSTFRQANADTANQIAFVLGVAEESLVVEVNANATNADVGGVVAYAGIGADVTNANASGTVVSEGYAANSIPTAPSAILRAYPAVGFHFYAWLEYSGAAGTTTWYGQTSGSVAQSGISGSING